VKTILRKSIHSSPEGSTDTSMVAAYVAGEQGRAEQHGAGVDMNVLSWFGSVAIFWMSGFSGSLVPALGKHPSPFTGL